MVACSQINKKKERYYYEEYTIHCIDDKLTFFDIYQKGVNFSEINKCDIKSIPIIEKATDKTCNYGNPVYYVGYKVSNGPPVTITYILKNTLCLYYLVVADIHHRHRIRRNCRQSK